jgi:hypothetical protein
MAVYVFKHHTHQVMAALHTMSSRHIQFLYCTMALNGGEAKAEMFCSRTHQLHEDFMFACVQGGPSIRTVFGGLSMLHQMRSTYCICSREVQLSEVPC